MTALALETRRAPSLSAAPRQMQKACACASKAPSHEECETCGAQRKARGAGPIGDDGAVAVMMATAGRPLAASIRTDMEDRFGADFGRVRIHDDAMAAHAADTIDARAFTLGNHIGFAAGHYDPGGEAGRHLLAHELAHTIQQDRGGAIVQTSGAAEGALEREADAAADAALAWAPVPSLSAAAPRVARAAATPSQPMAPLPVAGARDMITAGAPAHAYGVTLIAVPRDIANVASPLVEVEVDTFWLPETKGIRALDAYKLAPKAPLIAVPKNKGARASLKQDREPTKDLRDNWLQRARWPKDQADALWVAAGGQKPFPTAGGAVCHMDHVVELQLGGSGQPVNIQTLDAGPNMDSGRRVRVNLAELAVGIADSQPLGLARANGDIQLRLRFKDVKPEAAAVATPCQMVETAALTGAVGRATAGAAAKNRKHHTLRLPEGESAFVVDNDLSTVIEKDADNDPLRLAIPGLILTRLGRPTKEVQPLHARLDLETSRLPLADKSKAAAGAIEFDASKTEPPKLKTNKTNVPIDLLYLSPGRITRVEPAGGGINWFGEVTPTHKFLPKLGIAYVDKTLSITSGLDEAALRKKAPIPGAKVTKAEVGVKLAPDFEPSGTLAFELAPAGRKLMATTVQLYADDGLAAKGDVQLFIPGVKSATGQMLYRNRQWSMSAKVETKDLSLPYLKGGELTATYVNGTFGADGKLELELPGKGSGSLRLGVRQGKWLFAGEGRMGHPRFGSFDVKVQDDGDEFVATGHAHPELKKLGLTPDIAVTYRQKREAAEPTVTGKGSIKVDKPKLKGSLTVDLLAGGRFTAKGEVSYPIRDDLQAKLGIELDENERVKVAGEARLTKPIALFPRKGGQYNLQLFQFTAPIPGLSAGPIGLNASVAAGLTAGYGLGPAELRDVVVGGKLNPFEPDPDPVLDFTGALVVGANAHLGVWIRGSLIAEAGIGHAKGSLTAGAAIEAKGETSITTHAHYERGLYAVNAVARAGATLDLRFTLTAGVTVETLLGDYGPGATWTWKLAELVVPTGLGFAFEAPLAWDSQAGLKLPTNDQIKWEPPKAIDAGDLLRRIFAAAKGEQPAKVAAA